ncbi:hypothetical protein EIN_515310 [Entamoeba invadens IP1]|uniref:Uncharacterized protein n=1 Tax=Entamoeba invadens IP1 TaxID=370355 RepID=L7FK71_ENTIV|nr:hypothetical protein EIN_515310 [Entamoeba invadens IP1]ELP86201.1 hypothetical protein EIN_515310 [Entamoeba invadens IP1]|eukprot:XP_004185547.1 hypothetical protein EIN_515310 [Entamoeba invadens IP1]
MKQLERVYLMNVFLHLKTFSDVLNIINVNKKCKQSIEDLKVNPWLINSTEIEKYFNYFTPTTLNCNHLEINEQIIQRAELLKNWYIPPDKKLKVFYISKMRNFNINFFSQNLVVEVVNVIVKISRLECSPNFYYKFIKLFKKSNKNLTDFPRSVIINFTYDNERLIYGIEYLHMYREKLDELLKCIDRSVKEYSTSVICMWCSLRRKEIYTPESYVLIVAELYIPKMTHCQHYFDSYIPKTISGKVKPTDVSKGVGFYFGYTEEIDTEERTKQLFQNMTIITKKTLASKIGFNIEIEPLIDLSKFVVQDFVKSIKLSYFDVYNPFSCYFFKDRVFGQCTFPSHSQIKHVTLKSILLVLSEKEVFPTVTKVKLYYTATCIKNSHLEVVETLTKNELFFLE